MDPRCKVILYIIVDFDGALGLGSTHQVLSTSYIQVTAISSPDLPSLRLITIRRCVMISSDLYC